MCCKVWAARGSQFLPPEPVSFIHLWPGRLRGAHVLPGRGSFVPIKAARSSREGFSVGGKRVGKGQERLATGPPGQACTPLRESCESGSNKRNRGPLSRTRLGEFSTVSKNHPARSPGARAEPCTQGQAAECTESYEETSALSAVTPQRNPRWQGTSWLHTG